LITLVLIVKSGERWINSRIDNAGINSKVRGEMDKESIENVSFNSDIREKMDKESY